MSHISASDSCHVLSYGQIIFIDAFIWWQMSFVGLSFRWQIIFAATSFEPSVSNGAVTEIVERRREEQAQKFISEVQIWEKYER